MPKFIFLLLYLIAPVFLPAQHTCVFIGSYNKDKFKTGIYVYELDTLTGNLSRISSIKNVLNPSYLTISPNGKFIYSCTESRTPGAGSVSSFGFDQYNKQLTFINSRKSGGENPVYVSVHKNGKWLVNANYTEGSVSVYPLAEDGIIKEAAQIIRYTEGSINPERQDQAHIHAAVFSPDQHYLFLPDLGADKIRCYRFDTLSAQPLQQSEIQQVETTAGSGPRHITFHPNQPFAYCIEELTGTISAYRYDQGKLILLERIAAHPASDTGYFNSADIHVSPDGHFLYASNRADENNIAIFSILENGRLKAIGYQATLGNHPRIFALTTNGNFLIVANQISGDVVVFKRNETTGLLTTSGKKIKVPGASCVKTRDYE